MEENENNLENQEVKNIEQGTEKTENGIEISNDVIAVIAGVAVSEVQGVASMSGGFAGGITEVLSGKKNMAKGIKVEKTENTAKIDVNIIVEYGTRIPDIAFEIQNRVKKSVEGMTGFKVEEVNVHIQGVNTDIVKTVKKEEKTEINHPLSKKRIYIKRCISSFWMESSPSIPTFNILFRVRHHAPFELRILSLAALRQIIVQKEIHFGRKQDNGHQIDNGHGSHRQINKRPCSLQ